MLRWRSLSALYLCLSALPLLASDSVLPDAPPPQASGQENPPASPVIQSRASLPHINQREADQSDDQENPAVFSHHLIADRIWVSAQANFIFQAHTPFHSLYAGTNSFQ